LSDVQGHFKPLSIKYFENIAHTVARMWLPVNMAAIL